MAPLSMTKPRIIIHGGAGNIKRSNLPPASYAAYRASLLSILRSSSELLEAGHPSLDVTTHAVAALEDNPLFNCGKGAVFTRAGRNELEASVMVSRGYRKRGVAVSLLRHVRNPIKLAREMLVRGETDEAGVGAQGHCHVSGETAEQLAEAWGLELRDEDYFWTRRRWQEHKRGLAMEAATSATVACNMDGPIQLPSGLAITEDYMDEDPSWDGNEYLPQGTVGCVALDRDGVVCVATSTGGITNKLPGRIGDTPTLGAGFWAEEWEVPLSRIAIIPPTMPVVSSILDIMPKPLQRFLGTWLPWIAGYVDLRPRSAEAHASRYMGEETEKGNEPSHISTNTSTDTRAVAMSGTGNGDSFLRLAAVHTAALMPRLVPSLSLSTAVKKVAGPGGELQRSAGDRWKRTGEGEGGIIGIEYVNGVGKVVANFNCGGMFRAWVDEQGKARMRVFREEYRDGD